MVVKNDEDALKLSLEQLSRVEFIDQTELIVVDGSSNDLCQDIIYDYRNIIKKNIFESDTGIYNAFNKALKQSTRNYFMWHNAGDFLHPAFLKELSLSDNGYAVHICETIKFSHGKVLHRLTYNPKANLKQNVGFSNSSAIYQKSSWLKYGEYDESYRIAGDAHFILKLLKEKINYKIFNSSVYMNLNGISNTQLVKSRREYIRAYNEIFDADLKLSKFEEVKLRIKEILNRHPSYVFLRFRKHSAKARFKKIIIYLLISTMNLLGINAFRIFMLRNIFKFRVGKGVTVGKIGKIYDFSNVTIGDNTIIGDNIILDNRGKIEIGNCVNIGPNITIFTRGHAVNSPLFETKTRPVTIGNYSVFLSNNIILPGVSVGECSVVYPGETIKSDIAKNTLSNGRKRNTLLLYSPSKPK